jgi:hypothetical protein
MIEEIYADTLQSQGTVKNASLQKTRHVRRLEHISFPFRYHILISFAFRKFFTICVRRLIQVVGHSTPVIKYRTLSEEDVTCVTGALTSPLLVRQRGPREKTPVSVVYG